MPSARRAARTRSFRAVRRFSSSGCAVRRSVRKRTLAPDSRGRHGMHGAACRASAAKCGSTHRGGRCFSIIDPSSRPASMRGQPTSNVNKEPGQDLKISSIHDGAIVHGGAGCTLAHAVGCIAWADCVEPRRIPSGSCAPARHTRPSSPRHCLHACAPAAMRRRRGWRPGGAAWPTATTGGPHPYRWNAVHGRDATGRRHAALREAAVGTTGITLGRDDAPEQDRRARRAFRRAPAQRNGMHDAAWLITACNRQEQDGQAACGRDTMRPAAGGPDYVEKEMRCRPFQGISMNITGNRPSPSCGKVVFATD